jgi:hypothetical protein
VVVVDATMITVAHWRCHADGKLFAQRGFRGPVQGNSLLNSAASANVGWIA